MDEDRGWLVEWVPAITTGGRRSYASVVSSLFSVKVYSDVWEQQGSYHSADKDAVQPIGTDLTGRSISWISTVILYTIS